ncbi:MAG TPA: sugar phosphate nucleotidyltransferase [Flavobacteriaceae bacterium]|nr:sugar phosphate nucleotidyltransferase [Flavobacteriaceae bacterium]HQU20911.1 sugar phosphate nucleotidyltransferase [Flavobacteriaceae bacterium]HQU64395.1 sugar phosphate nucleotidyltransferase [Flavobacteriaceae bacterium]HRW43256.1 sugar phosphate nucleotidyltransferase [Flavobacteriaceae bacterium]
MMHNTLIILAAGASSRMKQSLEDTHDFKGKALLPLGKSQKPVIEYLLQNAKKAGYTKVILVVGKEANAFKDYLINNPIPGLKLSFAHQNIPEGREKPLGTADAVLQTLEQFPQLRNECFVVCNSDNLYSVRALELLRTEKTPNAFISYDRDGLEFQKERILSFALVIQNQEGYLRDIIEKPTEAVAENYRDTQGVLRVSMNLWKLHGRDAFTYLRDCPLHPARQEKELPNAILAMVKAGILVKGIPVKEHVPDLTSKEDIAKVEAFLEKRK